MAALLSALKHKMKRKRDLAVPIALMAGLIVIVAVAACLLDRAERVSVEEPVYQYVFEERDDYDGLYMKKDETGITIDNGYQTYESNAYPFYFSGRDACILTDDFLYLTRLGGIGGRVPYFSEIVRQDGRYLLGADSGVSVAGGMLHDGQDIFIFLEPTELTFNEKTLELAGFSYVVCFQGESILAWSYGDEEALWEEIEGGKAEAMMENGVRVDLVNDAYYQATGLKHLLFASPEVFPEVKEMQKEEGNEQTEGEE